MSGATKRAAQKKVSGVAVFSTGQAARICGVRMRTVDFWANAGAATSWIEPSGMGSDRWYRFDDLVVLAVVGELQYATTIRMKRMVEEEIRRHSSRDVVHIEFPSCILSIDLKRIRERVTAAIAKETGR